MYLKTNFVLPKNHALFDFVSSIIQDNVIEIKFLPIQPLTS